jgi:hypothetical protein
MKNVCLFFRLIRVSIQDNAQPQFSPTFYFFGKTTNSNFWPNVDYFSTLRTFSTCTSWCELAQAKKSFVPDSRWPHLSYTFNLPLIYVPSLARSTFHSSIAFKSHDLHLSHILPCLPQFPRLLPRIQLPYFSRLLQLRR